MYQTFSEEVRLLNIISPWPMGKSVGKKSVRDETWSAEDWKFIGFLFYTLWYKEPNSSLLKESVCSSILSPYFI